MHQIINQQGWTPQTQLMLIATSNTSASYSLCSTHTASLSSSVIDITGAETHVISAHHMADQCWLLLDSCSTVNSISDKDLLTDIHPVPHSLQVQCNAGSVVINHQGYLGSYPEPVWFNPEGIANLMSLHNMQQYYQVTLNTTEDNAFYINNDGGHCTQWEPSGMGSTTTPWTHPTTSLHYGVACLQKLISTPWLQMPVVSPIVDAKMPSEPVTYRTL